MPTAAEAVNHVMQMNARKRMPQSEAMVNDRKPVFIHNIYQKDHVVYLGSLGSFYIPACPDNMPFISVQLKGVYVDEMDLGDGQGTMANYYEDGRRVANDVVGINSGEPRLGPYTTNREWWGCFWTSYEVPTKEDLAKARKRVDDFMTMWLQEGDKLAMQGPKGIEQIGVVHRTAAKYKNQKREWAVVPETMQNCPACGDIIKPGVAICKFCNAILDREKAKKYGLLKDDPKPAA